MSEAGISLASLNENEMRHVIRVLSECIGIREELESAVKSGGVLPREDLHRILGKSDWNRSNATLVELVWTSGALEFKDYPRLSGYSLFWQGDHASQNLQIWIGRTHDTHTDEKRVISRDNLVNILYLAFSLHESNDGLVAHAAKLVKRRLRYSQRWLSSHVAFVILTAAIILWRGFDLDILIGHFGVYVLVQPVTRLLVRRTDRQSATAAYFGALIVIIAFWLWLHQALPTQVAIIISSMMMGGITTVLKYRPTLGETLGGSLSEAAQIAYNMTLLPIARSSFYSFAFLQVIVFLYEQPWSDVSYLYVGVTLVGSVVIFDYLRREV